jgi:hypothetical protein
MASKVRWLAACLPPICTILYIPWVTVGPAGAFFLVVYFVAILIVIETCDFIRKNQSLAASFDQIAGIRKFETITLNVLTILWMSIFLYLCCFLSKLGGKLEFQLERHANK